MLNMKKLFILLLCCFSLLSCSDTKKYAPKEGRLAVFDVVSPQQEKGDIALDKTVETKEWLLPFYNLQNKLPHALIVHEKKPMWDERGGVKADLKNRHLPVPVVDGENIYLLDATYTLTKLSKKDGKKIWQKKLTENKTGFSLIKIEKKLIALSTDGVIVAVDEEGKELWQKDFAVAIRAPLMGDKWSLYLVTAHNQFIVLNPNNGKEVWHYQTTKPQTWLTNMAPVAKAKGVVVVPFATGEVIAFEADSGLLLWIQMMVGDRPQDLVEVPQIVAAPVIDGDTVYLTGNANLSGAYDLKTGYTKWTGTFASLVTPVVSGNTLFVLTNQNKLVALNKKNGKVFWEQEIPLSREGVYKGLVLVDNQLMLSDGKSLFSVNPQTGEILAIEKKDIATTPIVTDQHLIIVDEKTNVIYQ